MQSHERWKAARQPSLRLLIGEACKSTEVTPIGAGRITSEATCQFPGGLGAKSAIGEYSSMLYPCLKVARRCLYNESWLKSGGRHSRYRVSAEIID
jgi:hypothetical protein